MKINTSIGSIWISADEKGVTDISFQPLTIERNNHYTTQAADEIMAYLTGDLTTFSVPLSVNIGTSFQQKVWQALQTIPYGQTASYLDVATIIGNPKAVRAIGQANKNNPIAIIIPCHRVIGKNGHLVGYMGSDKAEDLTIKRTLLSLESISLFEDIK